MATLQIRKKSDKVWKHIPSDANEFILSKLYAKTDANNFKIVEDSGSNRKEYNYTNITVYDDTVAGTPETFASAELLMLRLEELSYVGFNRDGEVPTSTLNSLTDVIITTPTAGQTLLYNEDTDTWYNGDAGAVPDVDLVVYDILSTDLSSQDSTGIVAYINALAPSVLVPDNVIAQFHVTDTRQVFELLVNGAYYGATETPITTADVLDFGVISASMIAAINHAATAKTTLVDADELTGQNSASSFALMRVTCLNVYNYIKAKTDTLYQAILVSGVNLRTINGNTLLGSTDLIVGGKKTQIISGDIGTIDLTSSERITASNATNWLALTDNTTPVADVLPFPTYVTIQSQPVMFTSVVKKMKLRFQINNTTTPNITVKLYAFGQNSSYGMINCRKIFEKTFTTDLYLTQFKAYVDTDFVLTSLSENENIVMTAKTNAADSPTMKLVSLKLLLEEV